MNLHWDWGFLWNLPAGLGPGPFLRDDWIFLNAGDFIGAEVLGRYMLGVLSDFVLLFLDVGIFFSLGSVLGFDRYEELVVFSLPD